MRKLRNLLLCAFAFTSLAVAAAHPHVYQVRDLCFSLRVTDTTVRQVNTYPKNALVVYQTGAHRLVLAYNFSPAVPLAQWDDSTVLVIAPTISQADSVLNAYLGYICAVSTGGGGSSSVFASDGVYLDGDTVKLGGKQTSDVVLFQNGYNVYIVDTNAVTVGDIGSITSVVITGDNGQYLDCEYSESSDTLIQSLIVDQHFDTSKGTHFHVKTTTNGKTKFADLLSDSTIQLQSSVGISLSTNGVIIPTDKNIIITTDQSFAVVGLKTYANDAAADADTSLISKSFYKITGSRALYQKP
jgi:hypothetical protein